MKWVSYTRSISSRIGEENPSNTIAEQNERIARYLKKLGCNVSEKYSDRKRIAEATEGFDKLVQDGMARKFDAVVVDSIFRCGRTLPFAIEALQRTFYPLGIQFAVVEDDFCSADKTAEEVAEYFNGKTMQDVRTGKIQCIVVKDLSRFGRDYIETGSYLETIFPMLHVRFIAINDDFDNIRQSDVDSLAVPIKNMVNSLYAKDISKKISLSYQMRREKGIPTSWCTPYGYQLNQQGNKFEATEDAKWVKLIYQWYLAGVSTNEIARRLEFLEVARPNERLNRKLHEGDDPTYNKWHPSTVLRILNSSAYIGELVSGKTQTASYKGIGLHPVEKKEWHIVENGEMVFCCGYKRAAGKFSKCYGGYYREYSVNAKVARAIKTVFYALDVVNQGMQEKQSITVRCMDIEDLEKQAEAIRVEQIKLYESYADGVLLRDAYIEKKKALSEKLAALQDNIRTEKEEQECADELDEEIRALTKQASEKTYIGGLTKECVDAFVSMVYLYDDQTMKIEFNCEDVIRRALEKYGA